MWRYARCGALPSSTVSTASSTEQLLDLSPIVVSSLPLRMRVQAYLTLVEQLQRTYVQVGEQEIPSHISSPRKLRSAIKVPKGPRTILDYMLDEKRLRARQEMLFIRSSRVPPKKIAFILRRHPSSQCLCHLPRGGELIYRLLSRRYELVLDH